MCGQDQKWIWLFRCWDSKICCISRILSWCFACWYTFRKVKSYFNNCWVGMVKNGQGLIYHGILKLSLSHKWFEELSRLIEWFLDADSDGMIFWFDCQSTISLTFKSSEGLLQLYFDRFFRKNSLWAKTANNDWKWPQNRFFLLLWLIFLSMTLFWNILE